MDLQLAGKRALVTAASRGIGRAVARALVAEGCRVAVNARDPEGLARAAREIGALAVPGDLSRAEDVARLLGEVKEHLGGLDVLVTNSGGPPPGSFLETPEEEWRKAFDLLVMSVVRLCRGAVPWMKEQGGGSIVALTSVSVKQPVPDLVLSNSLRMAVIGLTRTLADELGPYGIRVNSVLPGYTATERMKQLLAERARRSGTTASEVAEKLVAGVPLARLADPEETAAAVAFLASPRAGYITGTTLPVDGGWIRATL